MKQTKIKDISINGFTLGYGICMSVVFTPPTALLLFLLSTNPPHLIYWFFVGCLIPLIPITLVGWFAVFVGFGLIKK